MLTSSTAMHMMQDHNDANAWSNAEAGASSMASIVTAVQVWYRAQKINPLLPTRQQSRQVSNQKLQLIQHL